MTLATAQLPSPPTSPTSPRAATVRIRIKKRQRSLGNLAMSGEERTQDLLPSLSRIMSVRSDTPDAEIRSLVAGSRRKPSIAYYTPASPSPWTQRPHPGRTWSASVDRPQDGEPPMANGKGNVSRRSSLVLGSRSHSTHESVCSLDGTGTREREPLTLFEKHADLLHFIAQKERKCLELRDQLAAHEKELAELKRKWELVVNLGCDPLPNQAPPAGLGGAALDGLKEGVRLIAAGLSDLGGATQEPEPDDKPASRPEPLAGLPRESSPLNARSRRPISQNLSTSSMTSIQESMPASDQVAQDGTGETMATAPPLSGANSLSRRAHKRSSRLVVEEPTTSTSAVDPAPAQSANPANLDVDMSCILTPSPTLLPSLLTGAALATGKPGPKSPVLKSSRDPVPASAGSMSSWVDSMGKKLSELQHGQTFSKSQKRASLLLAGMSNTISAALTPGPTPTTPAPLPTPTVVAPTASRKVPVRKRPLSTLPHPTYRSMTDWLDDEEEEGQETVHARRASSVPDPKRRSPVSASMSTANGGVAREEGSAPATAASAPTVSPFDDDWNW